MNYPNLEKIKEVSSKSQEMGLFLEWLQEKGIILAKYRGEEPFTKLESYNYTIEKILAEYFGIDLVEAEKERLKILDTIRDSNKSEDVV